VLSLNLDGIKSAVYLESRLRDRPLPNLPAPFMNIHLGKELSSEDKDPWFLGRLKWEAIDFARWVLADEL
jgi:hypothetical protein